MYKLKVKLDPNAIMPTRAHEADAGMDLYNPLGGSPIVLEARGNCVIDTGVHVAIPRGFYGRIASKSGLNVKHDITSEGVVDSGYTGPIKVKLYNHGWKDYVINPGDKITQMIIEACMSCEFCEVDELMDTDRGANGFGSSGK